MERQPEAADDDVTQQILGIAIEVHRQLGQEMAEEAYRNAMQIGLEDAGFEVTVERNYEIDYEGETVGSGRADIVVDGEVVLELKAVRQRTREHFNQLSQNVRALEASRGLLLNFGETTLGIERYVNGEVENPFDKTG